jgi:hypothetical protein
MHRKHPPAAEREMLASPIPGSPKNPAPDGTPWMSTDKTSCDHTVARAQPAGAELLSGSSASALRTAS